MGKKKTTSILGGQYEVLGVKPGPVATQYGVVDLSKINEEMAELLVKAKSSYIRRIPIPKQVRDDKAKTDNAPKETKNDK